MKANTFLKQAEREARFVDALLLARYALTIYHGVTVIGDDENGSTWPLDFSHELRHIDEVLQMAGVDTTRPLRPPGLPNDSPWEDDADSSEF